MPQHRRAHITRTVSRSARRIKTVRGFLAALAALTVLAASLVPTTAAFAADAAAVRNTKTANATVVGPGDTFNWMIEVGCSVLTDECVNAVLTDTMPDEFILPAAGDILLTPALNSSERTITITGQTVSIAFTQNLASPTGAKGLTNGTVTVTIPVTVRSDLPYTPTPKHVVNTSKMVADNAPELDSSAAVDVIVPLELSAATTKSFSPSSSISVAGLSTDISLSGTNTSNAPVSTLRVQDPVDPTAGGNIFQSVLGVTSLGAVTWPSGATSATVSVWDSSLATPAWVAASPVAATGALALPAGVATAGIRGIRIDFTSGATALIPNAATTSIVVTAQNRAGISAGSHPNTVQSAVFRDALSATKTATANYVVATATSSVSAGKSITPDRMSTVANGASDLTTGTVTLRGANTGNIDLTSLTINEPSDPTAYNDPSNSLSPAHTGGGLFFDGFTSGVAWPAGATSASTTYYYSDGSNSTGSVAAAGGPALPAASAGKRVTGVSVTFSGLMKQGAEATVPFTIDANPAQVAPNFSVLYDNTIAVTGVDFYDQAVGPVTANDTVTVLADQINLTTTKSLTRGTLRATGGQSTIATLTTRISDYPDTTRSLEHIDMTDPETDTGLTNWYNYFNATGLVVTQVPAGATLSVLYRDSAGTYTLLTVLTPGVQGYTIPSGLRDSIYGIKLSWDSVTGFQPGQTLAANLEYSLRSTLRNGGAVLPNAAATLENCSASVGSSTSGPSTLNSPIVVANPCPTVTLVPVDPGSGSGDANFLDKNFINVNNTNSQSIINTRDDNSTRVRLSWSTDGYTGIDQMVIYDGAVDSSGNPDPSAWSKGMYDAFDLVSIPAINNSLDPLIRYDKVYLELYDRTTGWASASTCTQASPCNGSAPAYTLTTAERANTVAVRFVFTEGTNRPGLDPIVGSGVADSISHNRKVDLVFQLRNELRSPLAYPVVDGYVYNEALTGSGHSVIRNSAWSQATFFDASVRSDRASDTLELRDPLLAVNVTKTWTGGALPIPDGTVTVRPTSRVTLNAVNQTVGKVDSLVINEPNGTVATPNDSPFEQFNLQRFQSITHPAGATALTVTVTRSAGGNLTASGSLASVKATVLAWTAVQLADATGFTFDYTGRINGVGSSSSAIIVFDLELRATQRSGGAVVAGTVYNSTNAVIADERWDSGSSTTTPTFTNASLQAVDGANMVLVASAIGMGTTKTFQRTSETEPARTQFQLTLAATPSGSERVQSVTITDDRATFWNAFDLTGIISSSLTLPTFSPTSTPSGTVIQVEACVGGTWTDAAVVLAPASTCTDRGGNWVGAGTWKTQAQARSNFLPSGVAASSVEGIRVTVKRLDDSQWENPQAPTISIPLQVQRRVNLRTGGEVLTNLEGNAPAPGETVPGRTSNTLTADVLGIWGKTATASNSANYLYKYATSGVRVLKTPAGVKAPGRLFDYTLSVTNTGNWPIVNPVITDHLPSDSVGASAFTATESLTRARHRPARLPATTRRPVNVRPAPSCARQSRRHCAPS